MTAPDRFLVADIGATNARFSLGGAAGLQGDPLVLATEHHTTSDSLLEQAAQRLGADGFDAACLAIAGPVHGGSGRITNGTLEFDEVATARRLGCPVRVLNDFHALARALPRLSKLQQIGGGPPLPDVKAVLGPGSGLGMGVLVPEAVAGGRGWRVLASEGGHGDLAPGTPLESELLALLQAEHGHVSWETVLSGPGLVRLYGAVCTLWGMRPEAVSAEWISAQGVTAEEPVCHQTLELFFGLLGAAAGNLALTVCARGGVYLGGGIVPSLSGFAATSPLRRRFDERGALSELVRQVPLLLILDGQPGLLGALECLLDEGAPRPPIRS